MTNFNKGLLALVAGFILAGVLICFHLLGFLYPYLSSYLREWNPELETHDLKLITIYGYIGLIVFSPLSMIVYQRLGQKAAFWIAGILSFSGWFLASFITSFWLFSLVFGLLVGASNGFIISFIGVAVWRYFGKEDKPWVVGVTFSSFSFGPFLLSLIARAWINPLNLGESEVSVGSIHHTEKSFDKSVSCNVPSFLRFYGLLGGVLSFIYPFLLLEPSKESEEEHLLQENRKKEHINTTPNENNGQKEKPASLVEIGNLIRTKRFMAFYSVIVFGTCFAYLMSFSFKIIGLKYFNDDRLVTQIGSIGIFLAGLSRILTPIFGRNIGDVFMKIWKHIHGFQAVIAVLAALMMRMVWSFTILVFSFDICLGGLISLIPLVSEQLFREKGLLAFSISYTAVTISNIFVLTMNSLLTPRFGYFPIFGLSALLSGLCIPLIDYLEEEWRSENKKNQEIPASVAPELSNLRV